MAKKAPTTQTTAGEPGTPRVPRSNKTGKPALLRAAARNSPQLNLVNVVLGYEYAAVKVDDWNNNALELVPFGSLVASQQAIEMKSCYSYGSASRNREWMTEVGRRSDAAVCSGGQDNFVLVKMIALR